MDKHGLASQDVAKRIRIVHAGKRIVIAKSFEVVAAATLARKRLKIRHFSRQNGKTTERQVSPQRLVHYRDNWYLDAWCHLRDDIRSFSIDAITRLEVMDTAAKEVAASHCLRVRPDRVFPTSVGMNRDPGMVDSHDDGVPHERGDEPAVESFGCAASWCSPRAWG